MTPSLYIGVARADDRPLAVDRGPGGDVEIPAGAGTVEIRLLGGFEVLLAGAPVPATAWPRPQAATLVKVLALAPGHRLHREQLIDRLWPELTVAEAAPRLHKLAHYARRALGDDRSALVLRGEMVSLFPEAEVTVDVDVFLLAADDALAHATASAASAAADLYRGHLLPEDAYEAWTETMREHLRNRQHQLLRLAGRWEELLADDPAAEDAHVELMARHLAGGDHRSALRQFERMDAALRSELGVGPGEHALALRERIVAGLPVTTTGADSVRLVGRHRPCEQLDRLMADAQHGRGRAVFVSGAPGVGKSALLRWAVREAERRQWRVGTGVAASVEGAWPYAPVLDALADLCRRHPTLLDGLGDNLRLEIERGLAGEQLAWTGEGGHQRLFVAAAELLRLAAAGPGLLLAVDDMHEADEGSLRLVHYLARSVGIERALVLVGYRQGATRVDQVRTSLSRRNLAFDLALSALDRDAAIELVRIERPAVDQATAERIWEVSGGLPFAVVEMARTPTADARTPLGSIGLSRLAVPTRAALQRVAVIGNRFDTDQFVALTGLPEVEAFAALDAALAAQVVVHTGAGYRFRHALIRDALLADIPATDQRIFHQQAADRLTAIGAPPTRVAHHLIAAGRLGDAVPFVLRAVEGEGAIGAYSDALALVDAVRDQAAGDDRVRLLALRAHLLAALGSGATIDAYRAAIAVAADDDRRPLYAQMAKAAIMEGDFSTASGVLADLEPDGGPADAMILLAKANLAYLNGDVEEATRISALAGDLVRPEEHSWQRIDLLTLQALLAHHRGEFFARLRTELRRAQDDPVFASTLFDPYLCVVEFLLYGTTPYPEVTKVATSLRQTARRSGVLRAEAFATALLGEVALLAGDLDAADRELSDAVDLYREIGATGGEASALQRLAEVRLAQGEREDAQRLLSRALTLARWSMMALHLLQRIYGTKILAAPDPLTARALVDESEDVIGRDDVCDFCDIMLAVPAATACADVGDLVDAERYLAAADRSSQLWEGTAWQGAILEARAHLARARGDTPGTERLLADAAALFDQASQPLDAQRCREKAREFLVQAPHPALGL